MKQRKKHIALGTPLLGNSDPNALEQIIDQAEELINATNNALDQVNKDAQDYQQAYNDSSGNDIIPTVQTPTAAIGQSSSPMNHFWWVVGGISTAGVLIYIARK